MLDLSSCFDKVDLLTVLDLCVFPQLSQALCLPAGNCPVNRSNCSRRCRKSPRSTNVCPWRTRSCCGSCTTVICWRVPAASHPPRPLARPGTLPPSPQLHPYRPDSNCNGKPFLSCDLLFVHVTFTRERLPSQQCGWMSMMNLYT